MNQDLEQERTTSSSSQLVSRILYSFLASALLLSASGSWLEFDVWLASGSAFSNAMHTWTLVSACLDSATVVLCLLSIPLFCVLSHSSMKLCWFMRCVIVVAFSAVLSQCIERAEVQRELLASNMTALCFEELGAVLCSAGAFLSLLFPFCYTESGHL